MDFNPFTTVCYNKKVKMKKIEGKKELNFELFR